MDLALRLADQTQQRAQAIASTLTIVISVISILLVVKPAVLHHFSDQVTKYGGLISLFLLFLSLVVSLVASFPREATLTDPQWFIDAYHSPGVYDPLEAADSTDFQSVQQKLDSTYGNIFKSVLQANRLRGNLLMLAGLFLTGGVLLGTYVAIRLAGYL